MARDKFYDRGSDRFRRERACSEYGSVSSRSSSSRSDRSRNSERRSSPLRSSALSSSRESRPRRKSRSRSSSNSTGSYFRTSAHPSNIDKTNASKLQKFECKLCLVQTTCQASLESHFMGKNHLKRLAASQGWWWPGKGNDAHLEYKRESERKSLTIDERGDFIKLKKDHVALQGMYHRQSKELNELKRVFSEQEGELKLLREKRRLCEEEHVSNRFCFKQEGKEYIEYAEVGLNEDNSGGDRGRKEDLMYSLGRVKDESEYAEVVIKEERKIEPTLKEEVEYAEVGILANFKNEPRVKEEREHFDRLV